MIKKQAGTEKRTFQQLREHYLIEKELANTLRHASKKDRKHLYASLYDELYQRVPNHPQLTMKADSRSKKIEVTGQMKLLSRYLTPSSSFLEVGSGDCSLSLEVAKFAKKVYAIDTSTEITASNDRPKNFELIISGGIPLQKNSIDITYSRYLMEHLHPDDAIEQLQSIHNVLIPGGKYICITPNRLSGPHDISMFFDENATGLHLREYSTNELFRLFRKVGFSKIIIYIGGRGIYLRFPLSLIQLCERVIQILPQPLRKKISWTLPAQALLGITMVGTKEK